MELTDTNRSKAYPKQVWVRDKSDKFNSVCGFEGTKREEAVIVHRIVNDGSFFVKHSKKVLTLKLTLMI